MTPWSDVACWIGTPEADAELDARGSASRSRTSGVVPDTLHELTKRDLMEDNADLIATAGTLLAQRQPRPRTTTPPSSPSPPLLAKASGLKATSTPGHSSRPANRKSDQPAAGSTIGQHPRGIRIAVKGAFNVIAPPRRGSLSRATPLFPPFSRSNRWVARAGYSVNRSEKSALASDQTLRLSRTDVAPRSLASQSNPNCSGRYTVATMLRVCSTRLSSTPSR